MKNKWILLFIIFIFSLCCIINIYNYVIYAVEGPELPYGSYEITIPSTLTNTEVGEVVITHAITDNPISITVSAPKSIVLTEINSNETVDINVNFETLQALCELSNRDTVFSSNISLEEKDIMYGTWTGVIEYDVVINDMAGLYVVEPPESGYGNTIIDKYTVPANITFSECISLYDTHFEIEEEKGYVMYVNEETQKWSYLYKMYVNKQFKYNILSTDTVYSGYGYVDLQDIETSSLLNLEKNTENIDGDLDIEGVEQENDLEENQNDVQNENEENIDNSDNIENSDLTVKEEQDFEQEEFVENNQENSEVQIEENMSVEDENSEEELQLDTDIVEKEEESELEDNEEEDSNSENEEEHLENNEVITEIKEEEPLIDE